MSDAVFLSAIAAELQTLLGGQVDATAAAIAAATAPLQAKIDAMQKDDDETTAFVTQIRALLPQVVLTVADPAVTAAIGSAVNITPVTASGGSGALVFSATLPDGFSIDPTTGTITGTSEIAISNTVPVTVTDTVGNLATTSFTLTIS